jgi:ATP-dependent Lon protease
MLDNWMEKLLQNAMSAYMPKVESIAESRRAELTEMKSKVKTEPEEVEKWFEKEIEKLSTMDASSMLQKLR